VSFSRNESEEEYSNYIFVLKISFCLLSGFLFSHFPFSVHLLKCLRKKKMKKAKGKDNGTKTTIFWNDFDRNNWEWIEINFKHWKIYNKHLFTKSLLLLNFLLSFTLPPSFGRTTIGRIFCQNKKMFFFVNYRFHRIGYSIARTHFYLSQYYHAKEDDDLK